MITFEEDLKIEIKKHISHYDIKIPIMEIDNMLMDFLTFQKKLIYSRPRTVWISPELYVKLKTHRKREEILLIREKFINGQDVNIFQSKKLNQTRFHDHLVYEWNIYHLHLSTKIEKNFVKQVDELLFVYVKDDLAIFLDIEKHKPGIFGDEKWIKILHYNFPAIIEPYKVKGVSNVYPKVNSVERQTLWDKGYSLGIIKVENDVYYSEGIGRMTSGHNTIVVMQVDNILRWLYQITEQFEKHLFEICKSYNINRDESQFKLKLGITTFEIIELKSGKNILTFPEIFNIN